MEEYEINKRFNPYFYVIGLDEANLFYLIYEKNSNGKFQIDQLTYGGVELRYASRFNTLEEASKRLKEIKARYNKIFIRNTSINAIFHGKDFNPDDVKVFKVRYVMREIEFKEEN